MGDSNQAGRCIDYLNLQLAQKPLIGQLANIMKFECQINIIICKWENGQGRKRDFLVAKESAFINEFVCNSQSATIGELYF